MTEDYYYNRDWKCVEERKNTDTCPERQYVYGIRGRNDLICRDNYYGTSSSSSSCSISSKERHYAISDAMGSVTAVANTAGAVVERYSYTAFGQSQVMDKDFATRSMSLYDWQTRFHGESRDDETGYYNYGYRYYDSVTGRWPSRDPIGEQGGLNLYRFVRNNGINSIDVLGLQGKWKIDPVPYGDEHFSEGGGEYTHGLDSLADMVESATDMKLPKWLRGSLREFGNWEGSGYVDWKTSSKNGKKTLRIGWGAQSKLSASQLQIGDEAFEETTNLLDKLGFKADYQGYTEWECDEGTGSWNKVTDKTYKNTDKDVSGPLYAKVAIKGNPNYRPANVHFLTVNVQLTMGIDLGGSVSAFGVGVNNVLRKGHSPKWAKTFACRCKNSSANSNDSATSPDSDGNADGNDFGLD